MEQPKNDKVYNQQKQETYKIKMENMYIIQRHSTLKAIKNTEN